ncbi:DUF2946 family protein [Rhodoferax sp. U11-2br]|uniref:DUF2946 family protein n=1 Tax=Rhodoferax sp. U11-2br TaxID=2838878 RepID=UPI001BE81470|nr:DUF2946 family protein [Rhodoferax sp. U11-2br]MBT3069235.1 DUF2946 family protein [Rhodoferax sp. U11-2br]
MDDIVHQAMAKWPNVPDCYGWLGLDARGNWYLRDDQAQAAGAFASGLPGSKGSLLQHDKLIDFIGRNYSADGQGRWFFQNGPQRVFVELQMAPLVWRVQADFSVKDHIGRDASIQTCWLDEHGHLFLQTDTGLGLVHTQDMGLAADAVDLGLWLPQDVPSQDVPARFGFVLSPMAMQNA